ncbi:Uncharacterised protein [uncultured archaeon]|nr:Uncharacterised protein [uncultured archaeon]
MAEKHENGQKKPSALPQPPFARKAGANGLREPPASGVAEVSRSIQEYVNKAAEIEKTDLNGAVKILAEGAKILEATGNRLLASGLHSAAGGLYEDAGTLCKIAIMKCAPEDAMPYQVKCKDMYSKAHTAFEQGGDSDRAQGALNKSRLVYS